LLDKINNSIKNELPTSFGGHEAHSGIFKIENYRKIFDLDDLHPLYQNNGSGLNIPSYNVALKQRARSQNKQKIGIIKNYCEKSMRNNYYLRLANEHVEETNKFLFFDFYYAFLYCQIQKVSHYI